MTSKGVPRLEQMFESFDINKDGKLSMAELGGMLQARGPPKMLNDKKYFLITSDNQYVIKPRRRGYEFVSTGGNISEGHLKTISSPILVMPIDRTKNKYYIAMRKSSTGGAIDSLNIRSGNDNGRDPHMVWFGGTSIPVVILSGNNDTFNIFMAEDNTATPNIEIKHSDGDFYHEFLSYNIIIGGEIKRNILKSLDEQRRDIPSPFVNSLLDGKWKFVLTT